MEIIHLNQRTLATRWDVSEATLERWRSEGIGPRFLKLQVEFNRKPNPHISSLSAPVGSLETLARFRGRISRNRTCP